MYGRWKKMAEEDLIKEEEQLEEIELPLPEVVEIPFPDAAEVSPNIERLQAKQARLQQEINVSQAQLNELANKIETAQLAFQQCVVLLQIEEKTNGC